MEKSTKSTLDDVQDGIDRLVLALFDSVRGYNNNNVSPNNSSANGNSTPNLKNIEKLSEEYMKTMQLIDNLKGNHRTAQEQEEEIQYLQSQIQSTKESILTLEMDLSQLQNQCTKELNEILNDELLMNQNVNLNTETIKERL